MMSRVAFLLGSLILVACATTSNLKGVRIGMQKSDVLDLYGDPKHVERLKGQDRWTYVFYNGYDPIEKTVTFRDGRVIAISDPEKERQLQRELEDIKSSE